MRESLIGTSEFLLYGMTKVMWGSDLPQEEECSEEHRCV